MIDIYCRNQSDPGYDPNALFTKDKREILLSKIRMILFTKPGEVLGHPDLGVDLEKYVFETGLNASWLETKLYNQFNKYIPEISDFKLDIKVTLQKGEYRDICFIDIFIDNQKYLGVLVK
jgi:hypothetical protein